MTPSPEASGAPTPARVLRVASELPAPRTLADYEPFQGLARGRYGVSFEPGASQERFEAARAACRATFAEGRAVGVSPLERVRAVFFDMDATVIREESIVELAAFAGKAAEVSAVTERAMAGELDFKAALIARVAVLAGLGDDVFQKVAERLTLQPGIQAFVGFCREVGVPCYLVSGGFTQLAAVVSRRVGFAGFRANVLEVVEGRLTGKVAGDVVDAEAKRAYLLEVCHARGIDPRETAAVGDGANDLLMLQSAGVAVGLRPKPVLYPHLDAVTPDHSFLGPLLFGRDPAIVRRR